MLEEAARDDPADCAKRGGWNQRDLTKRAKVSPGYVGPMELGKRSPSLAVLQRVAKALGVPATELLG